MLFGGVFTTPMSCSSFSVLSVVLQCLLHNTENNPVSFKVSCESRNRGNLLRTWFMTRINCSILYENIAAWTLCIGHASKQCVHIHRLHNQTSIKVSLKHIKGVLQMSIKYICDSNRQEFPHVSLYSVNKQKSLYLKFSYQRSLRTVVKVSW